MYQRVELVGRLGGKPEMRYTPAGKAVTNFSVATGRKYKSADGQSVEETTWVRVSAWGRLAEVCNEYLDKGQLVFVAGRLSPDASTGGPRIWTGSDGEPRASFEITASEVTFLGDRGETDEAPF